jgi:CheY-like chemotaxis protein
MEALAMLETQAYDLVLMDCQMPVMDGFQATAAIRERLAGSSRKLPIIALTANSLNGDRDTCLEAGMDDYLSKPYSLSQLDSMMRRWLPKSLISTAFIEPVEPQPTNSPVLNGKLVQQLRDIDPSGEAGLLKEVMQVYLDSSAVLVPQTEQAAIAADGANLRRLAHSLKSSSANVGAEALSDLFRRLEIMGREERTLDAIPLFVEVRKAYRDVTTEIRLLLLGETCP